MAKPQSSEFQKENTNLYLKDIKSFLSLRKVAENQTKRKRQEYLQTQPEEDHVHQDLKIHDRSVDFGRKTATFLPQPSSPSKNSLVPLDQLDNGLNERLVSVYHQIKVDNFYRVKDKTTGARENSRELKARMNRNLSQHVDDIDNVYNEMDLAERHAYKNRKQPGIIKVDKEQLSKTQQRIHEHKAKD